MSRLYERYKYLLAFYLAVTVFFVFADFYSNNRVIAKKAPTTVSANFKPRSFVLSATSAPIAIPLPTPFPTPIATPIPPTPTPRPRLAKNSYQIAAIGDSMVETMGGNLEYLLDALKAKYPGTNFNMYNYGKGSENIVEALARFDSPYSYKERKYHSLADTKPEVIIIGSWAYNPLVNADTNSYTNTLTQIITKAKSIGSKVYLLAEIAPLQENFGVGPGGVNWPSEIAQKHAAKIVELIHTARNLAKSLGIEIIDVYPKTTKPNSPFGLPQFVSPHDNIHPSVNGHTFMAKTIVSTIKLD